MITLFGSIRLQFCHNSFLLVDGLALSWEEGGIACRA